MDQKLRNNEMFRTSHLMILISYTIFSVILIGESLLLGWEIWALMLLVAGLLIGWHLHIQQILTDYARLWVYSLLMMATYFFYGSHSTSTYDLCAVMMVVIMLYTMTGIKEFVNLCQFTFLITFAFDIIMMIHNKVEFDSLVVTRSMLHVALILMAGWIGRIIIDRWGRVLLRSHDEIEELKDGTGRLNDFLINLSHEIRTPINVIIGLTGICIEKEDRDEVKKDLGAVRDAGRKVGEQISDILDYSEIDRGNLTKNCEDYILSSVLNDLAVELSVVNHPGVELVVDVDPAIPLVMNTDINKLKKIIFHLLTNGLKYTNEGGVYVHIFSISEEYGVNLCIEVTDTGIGMDEEEKSRIFEDFYQGDSSRSRIRGGLGLGLTIVSGFVSSFGGFMTVKSEPGKGTTIRVSLPQKVIEPEPCMSVRDKEKISACTFLQFEKFESPEVREYYNVMMKNLVRGLGVPIRRVDSLEDLKKLCDKVKLTHLLIGVEEYESDIRYFEMLSNEMLVVVAAPAGYELPENSGLEIMQKPIYSFPVTEFLNTGFHSRKKAKERLILRNVRALVVDDEKMNLTVATGILKRYEMEIVTVTSGEQAIKACKAQEFDIIFMDHMMPGMDGIEAMRRIRSETGKDRREMAIVALTANAVSTAKEMFLKEGFDGFVSKPIELAELERVLKLVLPKGLVEIVNEDGSGEAMDGGSVEEYQDTEEETVTYGALRACHVDVDEGVRYCQGDFDFYDMLLKQFSEEADEKMEGLRNAFSSKDYKDYEIRSHGLKSTARMIGAARLSKLAKEEENAASQRLAFDKGKFEVMMERYAQVVEAINKDINGEIPADLSGVTDDIIEFAPEEV